MLGKVMKYEVRASARMLVPMFGLGVAMAAVLRLMLWLAPLVWQPVGRLLNALAGSVGLLLLVAIVLVTFVAVCVRFYQSMNTNEAYLTFTLPVKPSTHIWAKVLVGTGYVAVSILVALLCGMIFIPGFGFSELANAFATANVNGVVYDLTGYSVSFGFKALVVAGFVLLAVYGIFSTLLHITAAMAIGQQFGKNKLVGSVVAYFVLNTVEGILTIPLALVPMFLIVGRTEAQMEAFFLRYITPELLITNYEQFFRNLFAFVFIIIGIVVAITLVFTVAHYFITRYFYTKKLNLE